MARSYIVLGVVLVLVGSVVALFSYVVLSSVPLTAVGISTVILGLTSIGLANSRPKLSPEACLMFLKTGVRSTLAILEELEVKNKAVYLPRSMMKGHSQALILLNEPVCNRIIKEMLSENQLGGYEVTLPRKKGGRPQAFKEISTKHLLLEYGIDLKNKAIAVTALGNISVDFLNSKPGPTSDDIELALNYIFTRVLDIAIDAKVELTNSKVKVEVNGAELMSDEMFNEQSLYSQLLGSPVASVAAAICSEALETPLRITYEALHNGKVDVVLEVLP